MSLERELRIRIGDVICRSGRRTFSLRDLKAFACDLKILFIDFKTDTGINSKISGGYRRGPDAEEGVEENGILSAALESDTLLDEGWGIRCRVWTLVFTRTNCFIGNEPGISAASSVVPSGMLPALYIRFIGVRDTG